MQRYIFYSDTDSLELHYVGAAEGLGIPMVDIGVTKGYMQDGVDVQHADYQPRVFTLSFGVAGKTYLEATEERRAITRFFADKKPKKFVYMRENFTAYMYPVYLTGGYSTPITRNRLIAGVIQFTATNPWFKKDIPPSSFLLEEALLEYPAEGLEWAEDGIEFSIAEDKLVIFNNGDVESDAIIRVYGPTISPYINNSTTGQRIEVKRTLSESEILEINSATGRVDIIDGAGRHNAFNYITPDSEFIKLARGNNQIEFGSAGGGESGRIEISGVEYYAGI